MLCSLVPAGSMPHERMPRSTISRSQSPISSPRPSRVVTPSSVASRHSWRPALTFSSHGAWHTLGAGPAASWWTRTLGRRSLGAAGRPWAGPDVAGGLRKGHVEGDTQPLQLVRRFSLPVLYCTGTVLYLALSAILLRGRRRAGRRGDTAVAQRFGHWRAGRRDLLVRLWLNDRGRSAEYRRLRAESSTPDPAATIERVLEHIDDGELSRALPRSTRACSLSSGLNTRGEARWSRWSRWSLGPLWLLSGRCSCHSLRSHCGLLWRDSSSTQDGLLADDCAVAGITAGSSARGWSPGAPWSSLEGESERQTTDWLPGCDVS
jgi:hypothetical protein